MRTRMYGGVRGRKTKVGGKPTLFSSYSIYNRMKIAEVADTCFRYLLWVAIDNGCEVKK